MMNYHSALCRVIVCASRLPPARCDTRMYIAILRIVNESQQGAKDST
jgi:hypothetical protein